MRTYTVHLRQGAFPVLVREGFSVAAMVFGPFWLAFRRAWIAAPLLLAAWVLVLAVHWAGQPVLILALVWCQGLFGSDWQRRNLAVMGYDQSFVVLGQDEQAAMARWLGEYPGFRSLLAA